MPQILAKETHQNLTYQENKHEDFLLVEVEAILRHPDPAKITLSPPLFPKGGDVFLYKSGPHDRRVKDNYWWVNRGNNFHSKSQKRNAIMKTYFSLKDRNGSRKSDCLNGFRRHIYRLADAKDDRRTLMLVHYLGDEKLHTAIHKKIRNGSSRQGKVTFSNGLEMTTSSMQNLHAVKGELRTTGGNSSRIIQPQTKNSKRSGFLTIQKLRESSSADLKSCLDKSKHNKSATPLELPGDNLKVPTKIRRIDGNTYNIQGNLAPTLQHSVNQPKIAPHLWRENQQNNSQIRSVLVSRANTGLLAPVLQNKEKPQVRILDEALKNQATFHNRQQLNMSYQQRKKLQQLQKSDNYLVSLLPKSLAAAETLSFKNQQPLSLNATPDAQFGKSHVNPPKHLTSQNGSANGLDQSSSANCPQTDSRLQIDYMKLFEEASYLPQMGCDVFVLVSYPGCKPAYWGTKKYVEKFENSECLQPYVASSCLSVKLKDTSLSPKNLNHSEPVTDKLGKLRVSQSVDNTLVTMKKEPIENYSPDNDNRISEVTVKREIIDDTNDRDSAALANDNNPLESAISSVTITNNPNCGKSTPREQCLHKDNTFKYSLQRTIEEQYKSMNRTKENLISCDNSTLQNNRKREETSVADEMTCYIDAKQNTAGHSNVTISNPVYVKIESLADDFENR